MSTPHTKYLHHLVGGGIQGQRNPENIVTLEIMATIKLYACILCECRLLTQAFISIDQRGPSL